MSTLGDMNFDFPRSLRFYPHRKTTFNEYLMNILGFSYCFACMCTKRNSMEATLNHES